VHRRVDREEPDKGDVGGQQRFVEAFLVPGYGTRGCFGRNRGAGKRRFLHCDDPVGGAIKTTVVVEANSDIFSGECPSLPTLVDDPITRPCAIPADRVMGAAADALHHPYHLPPG
jgi:hypothetical protein